MGFFKRRQGKRTDELTLADFDSIWTKFCFLGAPYFVGGFENRDFRIVVEPKGK